MAKFDDNDDAKEEEFDLDRLKIQMSAGSLFRGSITKNVPPASYKPGSHGVVLVPGNSPLAKENDSNHHVVRVKKGDALVFYNYNPNEGEDAVPLDYHAYHAGLPAESTKWIANQWFHVPPMREHSEYVPNEPLEDEK